ncbi:MAG TPA: molecular chaperone [Arsenophonus nasoniae]|uniref:fimbrial biogenesis chaperone n=1 Tax=Arsenophonus nasoniae TaxID=638 RepID=UPI0038793C07
MALRTRIKLFFRPHSINKTFQNAAEYIKITKVGESLSIDNPTAYFFTLSALYNRLDKNNALSKTIMLPPFSQHAVENKSHVVFDDEILIEYINDEGQFINQVKKLK